MKTLFNGIAILFSILFAYAAIVQYNDPDAYLWFAIYGLAILASILFLVKKLSFLTAIILAVLYLAGTFMLWPEKFEGVEIGQGDIVNIERAREALGLLIVAVVMLVYALAVRMRGKS